MSICEITSIAFGGEGIGRVDNFVLFIPFTLPGEIVEVSIDQRKKTFGRGTLQTIIKKNPNRQVPPCPVFSKCGGCQLQHASYEEQLEIKKRFVEDAFLRIGKIDAPIPAVIPSSFPLGYRRHISLKITPIQGILKLGFISIEGNSVTPISSCLLFSALEDPILLEIEQSLLVLDIDLFPDKSSVKIIKNNPNKYIVAFSFSKPLPESELSKIEKQLQTLTSVEGFILKAPNQVLESGMCEPSFVYKNMLFVYSPFGFVQNQSEQSANIYDWISKTNREAKKVLDLYSGIGVSSLALAKEGKKVIGVELNPVSIHIAKKNAQNNAIEQVEFLCASAEDSTDQIIQCMNPDTIIVNPPKAGIDQSVLDSICDSSACRVSYISCSPPSLARDLALFIKKGFAIKDVQCFDMFPQTTHVEVAVQLVRTIH